MFTVQVLCYGKTHYRLAERCLSSIICATDWSLVSDLRVCFNDADHRLVDHWRRHLATLPVPVTFYYPEHNVGKYPIMKRMLQGAPGTHLMWFDDDSYLSGPAVERHSWWRTVANIARDNHPSVIGAIHHLTDGFRPGQMDGIRRQPWYTGKDIPSRLWPRFCTGGWLVVPMDFLRKWDYPFPQLHHNGGDTMLGELCHQQDVPLVRFHGGVTINADFLGRERHAERRGLSALSLPCPWEHNQTQAYDVDFRMDIDRINA